MGSLRNWKRQGGSEQSEVCGTQAGPTAWVAGASRATSKQPGDERTASGSTPTTRSVLVVVLLLNSAAGAPTPAGNTIDNKPVNNDSNT